MEKNCNYILKKLSNNNLISSKELDLSNEAIFPCLQKLQSKEMINFQVKEEIVFHLTKEGEEIVKFGSPEYNIYISINENGYEIERVNNKIGLAHAFKNKWIEQKGNLIFKKQENIEDEVKKLLVNYSSLKATEINYLKKRKLIEQKKVLHYEITKNINYNESLIQYETELTTEMIISNEYENLSFKPYNFNTDGKIPEKGNLHPLMKVREEFRNIFLSLGFTEMRTDKFVESSFWNFDALFQPQQHPSRDAHDTFFVKNELDIDSCASYIDKVKNVHEKGGYGSIGYQNNWDINEAKKGVLRTHTTAISARYLFKIAQMLKNKKDDSSAFNNKIQIDNNECYKLFSIDKVYRNESVDATHLAEFHQIEGVIVGRNLTLGELMGVIESFYLKLGMSEVKFKPAFNPYTEPSMEIFAFHKGLNKWIEIGNSGIFRPEMIKPMGFDDDVRVFGWGLSLERPTMIKYGIKNIRELVGHKVDYDFIYNSKICYF